MLAAAYAESVVYQQLPPPVQKQVLALVQGGGKIAEIDRAEEDGKVTFTFDVTRAGRATGYTLNDQGVIESQEVSFATLPIPVQDTIKAQVAQGELDGIDKNFEDGKFTYEVMWKSKDGKDHSCTVADDGRLESIAMNLDELSPAVQATIKKETGGGQIDEISKAFDASESYYAVSITRDKIARTFDVAESGALESRSLFITELPGPAQATVQQLIGNATIIEIDEVFDGRSRSFEIEATKDGKPYNFSVAPKGKFLGYE